MSLSKTEFSSNQTLNKEKHIYKYSEMKSYFPILNKHYYALKFYSNVYSFFSLDVLVFFLFSNCLDCMITKRNHKEYILVPKRLAK